METIDNVTYYTIILPAILGLIPVLYLVISILWNRKWVPLQRQKGRPTPGFGNSIGRPLKFAFKEDPLTFLPKVQKPLIRKLASLKTINWMLIIATFVLLGLKNENAWIPPLMLIISVWIRTAPILAQRNQIFQRMYAVAAAKLPYDRGAELNPWAYVKIKKWETLTTPGETHINIPSKFDASSLMSRDAFERHFNSTVTDNNSWIYEWKTADGLIIARPISHLPTMAEYPGSEKHAWSTIPLGIGANGEVTVDLTATPHALICGSTGSGKSVLQRNLIFHCIQHNDMWRFLGVDVKRVELTPFKKYKKTVLGIGANLEDGVEIVRYAKEVMETRYKEMEDAGVNHFKDLIGADGKPPYAIMLMVDEAFMFMSPEGAKSDEGKMRDQLHAEASTILGDIARLGRASGVHLVLATQRPDATVIKGELKANLDIRVAAGRLDSTPSSMVLDSGAATMLPGDIKGRGIVRFGGNQEQFQGYFAPQEWIDNWLKEHPGVEPDLYPALDGKAEEDIKDELALLEEGYNFDNGILDDKNVVIENMESESVETTLDSVDKLLEEANELAEEDYKVPSGLSPSVSETAESLPAPVANEPEIINEKAELPSLPVRPAPAAPVSLPSLPNRLPAAPLPVSNKEDSSVGDNEAKPAGFTFKPPAFPTKKLPPLPPLPTKANNG